MKLINPTLITLNNTLHIKADNLEAMEVDSSCVDELSDLVFKDTKWFIKGKTNDKYYLSRGVEISELSDRIFISRKWKPLTDFCNDCGCGTHKNQCDNADSGCIHFTSKAFLLPEKEDNNVLIPDFNSPRNWTEDYSLENGNYTCFCMTCKNTFIGYKRRVMCKECNDLQECLEIVDKKSYTIEEIEKAIDDLGFIYDNVKEAIINNLKK
jgi:hypothetical protein